MPYKKQLRKTLVEFKKIDDVVDGQIVFSTNDFVVILSESDGLEIKKGKLIIISKSRILDISNGFYKNGTKVKNCFDSQKNNIEMIQQ